VQPPVEPVRSHLTAAQVTWLIQGAPGIVVGHGAEITDLDQEDVTDLGEDFAGGTIERSAYATLHGTARFEISTPLEWGSVVIKPYMTITDGLLVARFNLGAYFTNTPKRPTRESPPTYDVVGYDLLYRLDTTIGDSYGVAKGSLVLEAVENILISRGYTKYLIDQARYDAVTPDNKTWALDPALSWMTVVNDLLAMVGYQGIWSDWNGYLRCERYIRPDDRAYEWYLPADTYDSILGDDAEVEYDYHEAPNRWVGVRSNSPEDDPPVEGDGVYTYTNEDIGPTSIAARQGLVITRQESLDVASHADLITRVQSMADADMSVPTTIATSTGPFPLAWHFDRYLIDDPDIGVATDVLATQWSLPLNGDDMTHSWTALSGVRA
jgi:hypothetical protein